MGALTTNILVVNNLRDIRSDQAAGKRTLAVRLGVQGTRIQYLFLLGLAYASPLAMWATGSTSFWVITTWLSLAWIISPLRLVLQQQGRVLNRALAETARLELVYGIALSFGLVLDRLL
jgi:1,4-dihydroxy-2-naphthoate octaprenyltransferase